jgi:hypothetical protein
MSTPRHAFEHRHSRATKCQKKESARTDTGTKFPSMTAGLQQDFCIVHLAVPAHTRIIDTVEISHTQAGGTLHLVALFDYLCSNA